MAKLLTKREYKKRRIKFQVLAGLYDFAVTILSFFVMVMCVYLLTQLYQWVIQDVPKTFGIFFEIFEKAFTIH